MSNRIDNWVIALDIQTEKKQSDSWKAKWQGQMLGHGMRAEGKGRTLQIFVSEYFRLITILNQAFAEENLTFWRRNYFFFNFSTPCI